MATSGCAGVGGEMLPRLLRHTRGSDFCYTHSVDRGASSVAMGERRMRQRDEKMAGSTWCSIQVLPEFGPKPELQDHKRRTACAV
ncbi:MAG: hypothetical protein AW07_00549 [Candidatus Accumulibacter sp. SK-11]|nr:MAG: hypothetical protein AW07_00549 [Candidatus Accumulibacter sp. SK-11]